MITPSRRASWQRQGELRRAPAGLTCCGSALPSTLVYRYDSRAASAAWRAAASPSRSAAATATERPRHRSERGLHGSVRAWAGWPRQRLLLGLRQQSIRPTAAECQPTRKDVPTPTSCCTSIQGEAPATARRPAEAGTLSSALLRLRLWPPSPAWLPGCRTSADHCWGEGEHQSWRPEGVAQRTR